MTDHKICGQCGHLLKGYQARIMPETMHVRGKCCVCGETKDLSYQLSAPMDVILCECYRVKQSVITED